MAGFLDQTIGTALLLLLILAITDELNQPPGANLTPLLIGLIVVGIGISFGGMHGYAINPARDFGPRLFTVRSEEHTSELQSLAYLVCRLLLEKKKKVKLNHHACISTI